MAAITLNLLNRC